MATQQQCGQANQPGTRTASWLTEKEKLSNEIEQKKDNKSEIQENPKKEEEVTKKDKEAKLKDASK